MKEKLVSQLTGLKQYQPYLPYLILIGAFFVRLPRMGESIWYDESTSTSLYLKDLPHLLFFIFERATHPPLHFITHFLWVKIFPDTTVIQRIIPLMYSMASLFVGFKLIKKIFGLNLAYLFLFLLSFSPVHVWYASEIRPYAASIFWPLMTFFAFLKYDQGANTRWLCIYSFSAFCLVFSYIYLPLYLVIGTFLLLFRMNRVRTIILCVNIVCLSVFGFFIGVKSLFVMFPADFWYLRGLNLFELWMLFFNFFAFGNSIIPFHPHSMTVRGLLSYPQIIVLQFAYLGIFIYGIYQLIKKKEGKYDGVRMGFLFLLISIPLGLFMLDLFGQKPTYIERSVVTIYPYFILVICLGLFSIKNKYTFRFLTIGVCFVQLVSLAGLYYHNKRWTVMVQKPDWRGVATYLNNELKIEQRPIVALSTRAYRPISYYSDHVRDKDLLMLQEDVSEFLLKTNNLFGNRVAWFKEVEEDSFYKRNQELISEKNIVLMDASAERLQEAIKGNINLFYFIILGGDGLNVGNIKKDNLKMIDTKEFESVKVLKYKLMA